jgi:hypothetical protein
MKRLVAILAQALVCSMLLGLPMKAFAEQEAPADEQQQMAPGEADPQFEEQLASEMQKMKDFEPSQDMKQALHELPEVDE